MEDPNMEDAKPTEPSLDECLKLLRGESDEQRLVGLLLVTKFVKGDDLTAVRKVFDAIGFQFINRLIKTAGAGQERTSKAEQRSYLHLALSILAAFCRVPELASLEETISKLPLLLQTLANSEHEAATYDCFEALLLIATASEAGFKSISMPEALPVVARRLYSGPSEAPWVPVAVKLLHCMLTRIAAEKTISEYAKDLALVILPVAKQLSFQQDLAKFEALSVLYSILVSDISMPVRSAIGSSVSSAEWTEHARTGLGQILHSRVAIEQKHLVLEVAQAILEIFGAFWLLGPMSFPAERRHPPPDRFFLLVVETLRVETAVLLNDVARSFFDPGQEPQTSDASFVKERRLMSCFALLECVINVVAKQEEDEQKMDESTVPKIDESILRKTVVALDEVVGLVIELLEDAQGRNQNQGEVLVACVRMAARFLAEAPSAHSQRCLELLGFMLAVTTKDDERSFAVMQFMIPFLTQITLTSDGCNALLACNGHKKLGGYLAWTVQNYMPGALVDICDILLNLLTKKDEIAGINVGEFVCVLAPLLTATDHRLNDMESDMVAGVFVSVLTLTTEDVLRRRPELGTDVFDKIIQHISNTVAKIAKAGGPLSQKNEEADLWDLILSACVTCVDGRASLCPSLQLALHTLISALIEDSRFSEETIVATEIWAAMLDLVTVLNLRSKIRKPPNLIG